MKIATHLSFILKSFELLQYCIYLLFVKLKTNLNMARTTNKMKIALKSIPGILEKGQIIENKETFKKLYPFIDLNAPGYFAEYFKPKYEIGEIVQASSRYNKTLKTDAFYKIVSFNNGCYNLVCVSDNSNCVTNSVGEDEIKKAENVYYFVCLRNKNVQFISEATYNKTYAKSGYIDAGFIFNDLKKAQEVLSFLLTHKISDVMNTICRKK